MPDARSGRSQDGSDLPKPLRDKKSRTPEDEIRCSSCGKTFVSEEYYWSHKLSNPTCTSNEGYYEWLFRQPFFRKTAKRLGLV